MDTLDSETIKLLQIQMHVSQIVYDQKLSKLIMQFFKQQTNNDNVSTHQHCYCSQDSFNRPVIFRCTRQCSIIFRYHLDSYLSSYQQTISSVDISPLSILMMVQLSTRQHCSLVTFCLMINHTTSTTFWLLINQNNQVFITDDSAHHQKKEQHATNYHPCLLSATND